METIAERLKSIQQTVEQSTLDAHRPPNSTKLLAVSKTKPVSDIVQAYEVGQRLFAENYVQEGVEKIHALQKLDDIEWHFIGPLQSNKTRLVAENFDWVHTIDRLKIANRLSAQVNPEKILNVCIQINIDEDENKAGIAANQLQEFASNIAVLPNLRLRGIMTIPKANQPKSRLNDSFAKMRRLYTQLQAEHSTVDTLSLGMSADMNCAINHGSTMVRIGSAIFGSRI